jgi:hypothetical protein
MVVPTYPPAPKIANFLIVILKTLFDPKKTVYPALSWLLSETVLVLEEKYWDLVDKKAKYWRSSFPEKVIDLNRFRRFRVRVRVPRR